MFLPAELALIVVQHFCPEDIGIFCLAQADIGCIRSILRQYVYIRVDDPFVEADLLRAEGLDTLPKYLAERVWSEGSVT